MVFHIYDCGRVLPRLHCRVEDGDDNSVATAAAAAAVVQANILLLMNFCNIHNDFPIFIFSTSCRQPKQIEKGKVPNDKHMLLYDVHILLLQPLSKCHNCKLCFGFIVSCFSLSPPSQFVDVCGLNNYVETFLKTSIKRIIYFLRSNEKFCRSGHLDSPFVEQELFTVKMFISSISD